MKYLKTHKDFAEHVNELFELNIPKGKFSKINEAFENDVTLSNSLIGQLFGWIFRKIDSSIQKGKMGKLLGELKTEFDKGHYSAIREKEISKKSLLYSTIVNVKKMVDNSDLSDNDFSKKFPDFLKKSIEGIRELIEGKGNVRISEDNKKLMDVSKEFYNKLSELYGKNVELKKNISDFEYVDEVDDKNEEDEKELVDEAIRLNIPNGFLEQLDIIDSNSKLEVIAINLESQLNDNIIFENNLIRIDNISTTNFSEIDRYFRALNISIEMINDSIIINNYDRFGALLEYSNNGNYEFIYDLNDEISYILNSKTPTGKVRGVGISKDSDYEEKGESVYKAIFSSINRNKIDFEKYTKMVNNVGDKNLKKGLESIIRYLGKFTHSKGDSTGFKHNYTNLIKSLEFTEGILSKLINEIGGDESGRKFKDDEYGRGLDELDKEKAKRKDSKLREINNKNWLKVNDLKYKDKNNNIIDAKPNPNPPDDLEFDRLSIINKKTGSKYSISGDDVVEMDGESTPDGILNTGQREEKEKREEGKSLLSKWLSDAKWLYGKKIEYKKSNDDNSNSVAVVLDKSSQIRRVSKVGDVAVRYPAGHKNVLPDVLSKLVSVDGIPYNEKEKSSNRDYVRSVIDDLFPDDDLYEKELVINDRERRDLLNDIKHKATEKSTLINPVRVMKIFNNAHYKYTVDNYENIPDGKQGSTLQGKGKGVNKKKHYKKMPDSSGRQIKLFKQWNDGVLDLIEEYGDYIPDKLKKFIVEILDNNKLYGNGGAQAKLLGNYFNIKVDIEDVGIGEGGSKVKSSKSSDVYVDTNDTTGEFKTPKSGSLQMKKENFKKLPFILTGNEKGNAVTTYVCYYMGTSNGLILFKFKPNNIDFLNNYKRSDQKIIEPKFEGSAGSEVFYGAIKIPGGGNKDFKPNEAFSMWSTDVKLETKIKTGIFSADSIYYLQGVNDGGVMRLDARTPGNDYGDFQHKDFKAVMKKFAEIKV